MREHEERNGGKGKNQACLARSWAEDEEEEEGVSRSRQAGARYPEPHRTSEEVEAWIVAAGNHCGLVFMCVFF